MRRTTTITLLLVFLINAVGFMGYLLIDWYEIRHEMKMIFMTKDDRARCTTLHLQKEQADQIIWIEKDHEFFYQERLFDVYAMSNDDEGGILIDCYEDTREAEFYHRIQQQALPNSNEHHSLLVNVFKFFSCLQLQEQRLSSVSEPKGPKTILVYQNRYTFDVFNVHFQPPWLLS